MKVQRPFRKEVELQGEGVRSAVPASPDDMVCSPGKPRETPLTRRGCNTRQNIPRLENDKFEIRKAFIAGPGETILVRDYCFALGTLVQTPYGPAPIETLRPGDSVYSYKDRVPVLAKVNQSLSAGTSPLLAVTLDNGKRILCTPDHKWLVCPEFQKDNPVEVPASDLKKGDRLLPLRRCYARGYAHLYSHRAVEYSKEHVLVAEHFLGPRPDGHHIHHVNQNTSDNSPTNLVYVPINEHLSRHGAVTAKNCWSSPDTRQAMRDGISRSIKLRGGYVGKNNPRYGDRRRRETIECLYCGKEFTSFACREQKYCNRSCYFSAKRLGLNHKVVSVEPAGSGEVWSIGVEGTHNYALEAGVFVKNCQLEMRILAALAQEKDMLQLFHDGKDIHMGNASLVYGVDYDDIKKAKKLDGAIKHGSAAPEEMTEHLARCLYYRQAIKAVGFGQAWAEVKLPQNGEIFAGYPA